MLPQLGGGDLPRGLRNAWGVCLRRVQLRGSRRQEKQAQGRREEGWPVVLEAGQSRGDQSNGDHWDRGEEL